ncbi:MAG: hypothetical protein IKH38_01140 [Clostridia bacterium]|nr:hypothetical protein [Clostridia bacterium]
MTYFKHSPEEETTRNPLFVEPVVDEPDDADLPEIWDDEELPPEELAWRDLPDPEEREDRMRRRDQLRMLFGMSDFLLVVFGTVVVLALVALIISLVFWVRNDVVERFPALQHLASAGGGMPL